MKLSELKSGETGTITSTNFPSNCKKNLMELGLRKNVKIFIEKSGCPTIIKIRDAKFGIAKCCLDFVEVSKEGNFVDKK